MLEEAKFLESGKMRHGDVATVACRPPMGPSKGQAARQRLACVDGQIEPKTLVCGRPCELDSRSIHQFGVSGKKEEFSHGEVTGVQCIQGFQPVHVDLIDASSGLALAGSAMESQTVRSLQDKAKEQQENDQEGKGGGKVAGGIAVSVGRESMSCDEGSLSRLSLRCFETCPVLSREMLGRRGVLAEREDAVEGGGGVGLNRGVAAGALVPLKCSSGRDPAVMADGRPLPERTALRCEGRDWAALPVSCVEPCAALVLPLEMKGDPGSLTTHSNEQKGEGSSIPFGESVVVHCDEDQNFGVEEGELVDIETVKCMGREKGFSPLVLRCHKMCISAPSNVNTEVYKMSGPLPAGPPYRHGATLQFECADGFSSSDAQITTGKSLAWQCG
uniref:Sushi domain-containing protein n=1 Tax=Chromera velia CCMP2878 TaxID=1169474 RepID=A0A0G4HTS6_9ALVE|eukprot:Cvel_31589.t1-p1 / transcript=Cvel_31589.t1 / gene=Cvel_31589 / organism=Chromera_velia_CCMP2878 / gene_product=hypothetical protein / transcript_product=hypothetical protein / location=Cvel_scaffold4737:862-2022(-) / protein_length=387 / sequence_SO=supercontig / SO=protein_coding / is_pseudo=false